MSPTDRDKPEHNVELTEPRPSWEEATIPPTPPGAPTFATPQERQGASRTEGPANASRQFGEYELLDEIARGGMGVVYKARQLGLNRVVALKMILAGELAGDEAVQRFQSEAEAAAQLEHPGIVPIHEIGSLHGQHFYTMSFVEGPALQQYHDTGMEDPVAAAGLVLQLAEAVDYAHEHGIVHRDLKPANVLLDKQGDPKITDFGLAKCGDSSAHLTRTGQIVGTPGYMAPEQAAGESSEIGAAADIYAIGGILYFTLTGRPPFRAANVIDTLVQSLQNEPTPPRTIDPSIPKPLEQICMRCLERIPADRYESAMDVAKDLDSFLRDAPIQARPPTLSEKIRRLVRNAPVLSVHLIALTLLLVVAQLRYVFDAGRDFDLHLQISGLLVSWALVTIALHYLPRTHSGERVAGTMLLCVDAALVTVLFSLMSTPDEHPGPLLIGYPLIVVAGAMYLHVGRIVIVTIASIASYLTLLIVEPSLSQPIHYHFCFLIMLLAIAACMINLVQRVRTLKDYFETRR